MVILGHCLQRLVISGTLALGAIAPFIKTAARYPKNPAHQSHFELAPMHFDECIPQFECLAKEGAFFSRVCSSFSRAFSRRNALSSSYTCCA